MNGDDFYPHLFFPYKQSSCRKSWYTSENIVVVVFKKNKKQPFLAALTDFPLFGKPVYRITCQINITESWLVLAQTKEDPSIIEMYQDKFWMYLFAWIVNENVPYVQFSHMAHIIILDFFVHCSWLGHIYFSQTVNFHIFCFYILNLNFRLM